MSDVSEIKQCAIKYYKVQCDICGTIVKNPGHPVFCRRKCDLCGIDLCDSAKCGETAMYDEPDGDIAARRFCIRCLENRNEEVMNILKAVGYEVEE